MASYPYLDYDSFDPEDDDLLGEEDDLDDLTPLSRGSSPDALVDDEDAGSDSGSDESDEEEEVEVEVEVEEEEERGKVEENVGGEFDQAGIPSCPICFKPWTSDGPHRVCCFPCGHVYGRSCLERWLQQCGGITGKCPQCNRKFRQKHIVNLYAPVVAIPHDSLEKEPDHFCGINESSRSETHTLELPLQQAEGSTSQPNRPLAQVTCVHCSELQERVSNMDSRVDALEAQFYQLADLQTEVAELRSEMAQKVAELHSKLAELRSNMSNEAADLQSKVAELRGEMDEMRRELTEVRRMVAETRRMQNEMQVSKRRRT